MSFFPWKSVKKVKMSLFSEKIEYLNAAHFLLDTLFDLGQ